MQDDPDRWSATTPFYDLDLEGVEDDIEMYRQIAGSRRGSVLEIGCGTGRVAIPLARDGLRVTGVDYSPAMLAVARARSRGLRVSWVEGDMREVRLGRTFATVLVPFGTLQHLATPDEVVMGMQTVAAHLARNGYAVVDIESPHPEDLKPGPQPLVMHWTRAWQGGQVSKLVAVDVRPAEGLREVTFHFDAQAAEGSLRRSSHTFVLRVITAGELELAARLAGLELVAAYGDYEMSPVSDGDDRLIAVFGHAR
jgi:SAM-dependent methyltransferase